MRYKNDAVETRCAATVTAPKIAQLTSGFVEASGPMLRHLCSSAAQLTKSFVTTCKTPPRCWTKEGLIICPITYEVQQPCRLEVVVALDHHSGDRLLDVSSRSYTSSDQILSRAGAGEPTSSGELPLPPPRSFALTAGLCRKADTCCSSFSRKCLLRQPHQLCRRHAQRVPLQLHPCGRAGAICTQIK